MTEIKGFERTWEDLGNGFAYSPEFNPDNLRASLGLDGHPAERGLIPPERDRRLMMLFRGGHLPIEDRIALGIKQIILPSPTEARERGSSLPDPVPGKPNQHLLR